MNLYDGDTFERSGRTFRVKFEHDDDSGPPWEQCDGHGIIREGYESEKRPGWRKLAPAGARDVWKFYDVAESMKIARRDGWDAKPYKTGTAGERAARAVESDYQFLRAWCNDEWGYVGVIVTLLDSCGNDAGKDESLWGVETWRDYHQEVALELADGILAEVKRERINKAKETRERNYWAARDVATV